MRVPPNQERVRDCMDHLAQAPPQVLLLEGGTRDERMALACYWAARLNCQSGNATACLKCPSCARIAERAHRDFFVFDGAQGNIKVDEIRELKHVFGEPPRGGGRRVVVFAEAQHLTGSAANSLLKVFEEPNPGTVFVIMAAQRERLLPTLVSRSWALTLAWPDAAEPDPAALDWLDALARFWETGRDWFPRTSARGAVDRDVALSLVLACQSELVTALSGRPSRLPARLTPQAMRSLDLALEQAQQALSTPTPVNPALTLDWLAVTTRRAMKSGNLRRHCE